MSNDIEQERAAYVPDAVWEALQRLIEDADARGPASREDARAVARWRGRFIRAGAAPAGGAREEAIEAAFASWYGSQAIKPFPHHIAYKSFKAGMLASLPVSQEAPDREDQHPCAAGAEDGVLDDLLVAHQTVAMAGFDDAAKAIEQAALWIRDDEEVRALLANATASLPVSQEAPVCGAREAPKTIQEIRRAGVLAMEDAVIASLPPELRRPPVSQEAPDQPPAGVIGYRWFKVQRDGDGVRFFQALDGPNNAPGPWVEVLPSTGVARSAPESEPPSYRAGTAAGPSATGAGRSAAGDEKK